MTSTRTAATPPQLLVRRAVVVCLITTLTVAIAELIIGWRFNLLSVFTEGLHTAADLIDSIAAFLLISIAHRPPDREHPFGHGKYDTIASLIGGLSVAGSGVYALYASGRILLGFDVGEPQPTITAMAVLALASVIYWIASSYALRVAAQTKSPTAYSEAIHIRTHVYITAGLFAGIVLSASFEAAGLGLAVWIDPLVALVLGLMLVYLGIDILRRGYKQMVDTALPQEELDEILAILNEFRDEFIEVHAIRSRRSGIEKHIDAHLVVNGEMTVRAGHDLAHRIEDRVLEKQPDTHLLVHIEPASDEELARYQARGERGAVPDAEAAHVPSAGEAPKSQR